MINAALEKDLAISQVFPTAWILACCFNIKKNIKEPRNAGKPDFKQVYEQILKSCGYLHYYTSAQVFESRKLKVLSDWSLLI